METTERRCAHPLERKALEQLKQHGLVQPGDRVIAAVSGGADSMALLLFFLRWGEELGVTVEAAHIDHGLRGEDSARDAAFVAAFCAARRVPLHLHRAEPAPAHAGEDWARRQRYAFFDRLAEGGARIATAHTLNDQAETLLLRLARGCSTAGAAGIPVRRGPYIRPFLTVERAETEDYCRTCGQSWVEDATNAGDGYARNRVRHTALPALETVNPRAVQALARFSARMAAVDGYLTAQADTLLQQAACAGGWQAAPLADAHPAVRDQALAAMLGADAQDALVARLAGLLAAGQGSVNLPRRGRAVLQKGVLRLEQAPQPSVSIVPTPFLAPGAYPWPDGRSLRAEVLDYEKFIKLQPVHKKDLNYWADYDKIQQYSPVLRTRQPGDRYAPAGKGHTKTLKKWLNELHIPPEARALLPLLAQRDGDRVLWLCGRGFARGFEPDERTRRVLRLTVQQENEMGDTQMSMNDDILRVLYSEEELEAKCAELGAQISKDYEGKNLLLVSVLKGAVVFMTDLMRHITVPCAIDFMVVSSYGSGAKTSGVVKIVKDLDTDLTGKDLLIVEDILDTGMTLSYLKQLLQDRNPSSIRIATLLDKPERRRAPIRADYIGYQVPDEFVVGYGLDYDEKYRNLPYVGILKPAVYGGE